MLLVYLGECVLAKGSCSAELLVRRALLHVRSLFSSGGTHLTQVLLLRSVPLQRAMNGQSRRSNAATDAKGLHVDVIQCLIPMLQSASRPRAIRKDEERQL